MSVPEELARREDRLARIAEAKATIAARAKERFAARAGQAPGQACSARRAGEANGLEAPGGRPPQAPTAGSGPTGQVNLTGQDSRIMPVAGGGFEQAYNAAMAHRPATLECRQACALRKQTPEPVFGIIKAVMGFRPRPRLTETPDSAPATTTPIP